MIETCSTKRVQRYTLSLLSVIIMTTSGLGADDNDDSECKKCILVDANGKRYIAAVCAEDEITVDGRLDDAAWQDILFQGYFTQREPNEGEPATERTEVGVLYDKHNIYFGLKCYDSEPDRIIANEMRRDAMMWRDDTFSLILDTYHDGRGGFLFETNPNGARRDQVIANEGRNINSAWDGVWYCKARINEEGWFAEIAIPWKTLRFAEGDSAIWGVNFSRTIRRKNEDVYWQLVPRDLGYMGMFRLSEAGCITGMANLKMGGNVELKPYFMGGLERDEDTEFTTERMNDVGLDAKLALTPNLALDFTVNTDFAQVEADREQVNLTRFSLYYPEKREFFLEGAEIFSFGRSGGRGFGRGGGGGRGSDLNLFYSRRIGLVEGEEVRILGGAKMVGKIGQYHVGVLNMLTDKVTVIVDDEEDEDNGQEDEEGEEETFNITNFTVLRLRRDILRRGSVGFMFLNKEEMKSTDYNRSVGIDAYIPITDHFTISSTLAGSFEPTEGVENKWIHIDKNLAGTLDLRYDSDLWDFSLNYMDIGDLFNPEVGFVRRVDYKYTRGSVEYSPRPKNARTIRQFRYQLNGRYRTDHTNRMLDSEIGASFSIRFQNSSDFTIGIQRENEYIDEDWEVREGYLIPVGEYPGWDYYIRASSDRSRPISGRLNINSGNYYSGKNLRFSLSGTINRIKGLQMELDYNRNFVDLPEGSFKTNTYGIRTYFYFSTELYLKAYVQLNDDKLSFEGMEKLVSNFMLRWIYSPGSNLYIVYNDCRMMGPGHDEIQNRTFMLKTTFFWRK